MGKTVIEIQEVGFRYNSQSSEDNVVLEGVSFDLRESELLCIVGPSGCGKTTLLNLIAGLLEYDQGKIKFLINQSVERKPIGYIFQFDALLPWRDVKGNLLLGLELNGGGDSQETKNKIDDYLDTFNLDKSILLKYPSELSGGMRQRVAIIQSLMYDPQLMLLDEPFASLDFYTKLRLEGEFWNMVKKRKKAAILVTHDIDEAIAIGDRVLLMGGEPGGIVGEFQIDFDDEDRAPDKVRGMPRFAEYFDAIWSELSGMLDDA